MWYMGEESVPGTENSKCKGSGQGKAQNDLENVRTIVTGAIRVREGMVRDKIREGNRDQVTYVLVIQALIICVVGFEYNGKRQRF